MFQFLCFAVTVDPETKTVQSRNEPGSTYLVEAADAAEAVEKAGNHLPLHLGEQMATVKVGQAQTKA
jgi:hypothetical protein